MSDRTKGEWRNRVYEMIIRHEASELHFGERDTLSSETEQQAGWVADRVAAGDSPYKIRDEQDLHHLISFDSAICKGITTHPGNPENVGEEA